MHITISNVPYRKLCSTSLLMAPSLKQGSSSGPKRLASATGTGTRDDFLFFFFPFSFTPAMIEHVEGGLLVTSERDHVLLCNSTQLAKKTHEFSGCKYTFIVCLHHVFGINHYIVLSVDLILMQNDALCRSRSNVTDL